VGEGKGRINGESSMEKYGMLQKFACHPCTGATLIFSVHSKFSICAAKVNTKDPLDEGERGE